MPAEATPECDYYVAVSRVEERPRAGIWPIGLKDALPKIPVPLRPPPPDAVLDLQAVLDQVYDAAGYDDYLYDSEPQPPLTPAQNTWPKGLLTERSSLPVQDTSH